MCDPSFFLNEMGVSTTNQFCRIVQFLVLPFSVMIIQQI